MLHLHKATHPNLSKGQTQLITLNLTFPLKTGAYLLEVSYLSVLYQNQQFPFLWEPKEQPDFKAPRHRNSAKWSTQLTTGHKNPYLTSKDTACLQPLSLIDLFVLLSHFLLIKTPACTDMTRRALEQEFLIFLGCLNKPLPSHQHLAHKFGFCCTWQLN